MKLIEKAEREWIRLVAKISDRLFKTTKFVSYQEKYSNYYQNDYVLKDDEFSFVHILRSGGSFFHEGIQNNFTNFYFGAHNAVSLKCNPKNFKYITILRDPIQRVYSYFLQQKKNKRLPYYHHANVGLDFFIQKSWACRNGMCKFINGNITKELNDDLYLIAINNLRNFYFVIDFDNFKDDSNKLMLKLKINKKIDFINNFKMPNKREISITDQETIKNYNYFDLKLFQHFKDQSI